MKQHVRVSVPNSVLLVMDQTIGLIPESMNDQLVSTSDSCIAIGTVSESDEQATIELTDESPEADALLHCVSKSSIQTPNREISVCSVHDNKYLSIKVEHGVSEIQIWVNHMTEPDRIVVVVGSDSRS